MTEEFDFQAILNKLGDALTGDVKEVKVMREGKPMTFRVKF